MIALIDADSLLFLSLPRKDEFNKTVEECVAELENRIKDICKINNTEEYVLFFTGSENFRKHKWKYSKNYKDNRKNVKVPPTFKYLLEYCIQKHGGYIHPKLEADDLVSYFKNKISNSIICSPDKDVIFQNTGIHYNHKKGEFIEVSPEYIEYFLYKQIGMGDAGDGVVGIEGVGEKTIDKWFKNKKNLTYAQVIIKAYVDKYGVHEGINRFYESFSMVYLLNSDEDMMREIGELPKFPDIHKINDEREFIY